MPPFDLLETVTPRGHHGGAHLGAALRPVRNLGSHRTEFQEVENAPYVDLKKTNYVRVSAHASYYTVGALPVSSL